MVNVIIDSNLLFNRFAFYLANNKGYTFENESEKKELVKYFHSNISNYIKTIDNRNVSNIHLVFDYGKSWRANLKLFESKDDYKKGRNKDAFNKIEFDRTIERYKMYLREKISIHFHRGLEADDIIAKIADYYYQDNKSSIIVTSDSDMLQLVKSDRDKFVTVYNPDYKIQKYFIDDEINCNISDTVDTVILEDFSRFFDESNGIMTESNVISIESLIIEQSVIINPLEKILVKVFSGDKTDNIPSSFIKYNSKSSNSISFGEQGAKTLVQKLKNENDLPTIDELFYVDDTRKRIAIAIFNVHGGKDFTQLETIENNIIRNIQLVVLNQKYQKGFNLENAYQELENNLKSCQQNNKFDNSLLEGTDFYYEKQSNYFRD